ncbi:MAG: UbiA family prenyltransferase, partial [Candidatus Cloacimonadaceae bacterium]|nr:UbiA family prenyltransferase [Candidatus Cloacimonadaceae bacterium]
MNKIIGLVRLMRLELPLAAGICVIMGQIFALSGFAPWKHGISAFLSVVMISASILVMNDYFDYESDKINAPKRPIPANLVKPIEALVFALILLFCGLLLSYMIGIYIFVIAMGLAVIGFLYNRFFKRTGLAGNIMVSFSVGMTFIYGGASVCSPFHPTVLLFALMVALIDLGEEIAADAMDIDGDLLIKSRSLAIKHGKSTALLISSLIFSMVIILSILPFIFGWFATIYLLPILIMDLSIIYSTLRLLQSRDE